MLRDFLKEKGFSEKNVERILSYEAIVEDSPVLLKKSEENIEFLEDLGIPLSKVRKMIIESPTVLTILKSTLEDKLKYLKGMGYTDAKAVKLIKDCSLIFTYATKSTQDKFDLLINFGLTKNQALATTAAHPRYYSNSLLLLQKRLSDLIDRRFSKLEAIRIVSMNCRALDVPVEVIDNQIENIQSFGFSFSEAKSIIVGCPYLISSSKEILADKIRTIVELGLKSCILLGPYILMQGTALTRARARYFSAKKVTIDEANYNRLFKSSKEFEQRFNISNEEVLKLYGNDKIEKI